MNKIQEKFDGLPFDFDKEALWQKIEKPRKNRRFNLGSIAFIFMVLFVSVISFLFLNKNSLSKNTIANNVATTNSLESIEQQSEDVSSNSTLKQSKTNTQKIFDQPTVVKNLKSPNLIKNEVVRIETIKSISKGENKNSTIQRSETKSISKAFANDNKNQRMDLAIQQEPTTKKTEDIAFPKMNHLNNEAEQFKTNLLALTLLPSKNLLLETKMELPNPPSGLIEPLGKQQRKNRIGWYVGIGKHQAIFTPLESGNINLRDSFEQAQNDLVIGLTYERKIYKDFFLSFSSEYNLYKEKILTSYLRELPNSSEQVDYQLYNHYHVFSGNLLIGKAFRIKGFFFDLSSGAGLNFYQKAEVDYFKEVDVLVEKREAAAEYAASPNFYFLGRGAIRKQLTQNLFFRTGIQYKSTIDLNNSSAEILHQIKPLSWNFEIGYTF